MKNRRSEVRQRKKDSNHVSSSDSRARSQGTPSSHKPMHPLPHPKYPRGPQRTQGGRQSGETSQASRQKIISTKSCQQLFPFPITCQVNTMQPLKKNLKNEKTEYLATRNCFLFYFRLCQYAYISNSSP